MARLASGRSGGAHLRVASFSSLCVVTVVFLLFSSTYLDIPWIASPRNQFPSAGHKHTSSPHRFGVAELGSTTRVLDPHHHLHRFQLVHLFSTSARQERVQARQERVQVRQEQVRLCTASNFTSRTRPSTWSSISACGQGHLCTTKHQSRVHPPSLIHAVH